MVAETYAKRGVAAYTKEFDELYTEVIQRTGAAMTRADFWRLLANARKRGVLPRLKHGQFDSPQTKWG